MKHTGNSSRTPGLSLMFLLKEATDPSCVNCISVSFSCFTCFTFLWIGNQHFLTASNLIPRLIFNPIEDCSNKNITLDIFPLGDTNIQQVVYH